MDLREIMLFLEEQCFWDLYFGYIIGLFSSLVVTRIMGEVKILINELEGY